MKYRILPLAFFLIALLVFVSLVQSIVVLGPEDVSRIGRVHRWQQEKAEGENPILENDEAPQTDDTGFVVASAPNGVVVKINVDDDRPNDGFRIDHRRRLIDDRRQRLRDMSEMHKRFVQDAHELFAKPFMQPFSEDMPEIPHSNNLRRLFKRMSSELNRWMTPHQRNGQDHEMIDEISGMRMGAAQDSPMIRLANIQLGMSERIHPRDTPISSTMSEWRDRPARDDHAETNDDASRMHHHRSGDHHDGEWRRRISACRNDMYRLCSSVLPNPSASAGNIDTLKDSLDQVMACLSDHQSLLSPQCAAEVATCTSFQCAADAAKLCPAQVAATPDPLAEGFDKSHTFFREKKRNIIKCLEQSAVQLSGKCLTAINNRRIRHGQPPIAVISEEPESPPSTGDDERSPDSSSSSSSPPPPPSTLPQWGLITIVSVSIALVFIGSMTVFLLIQHKRRRQREALHETANSLNLPPPPVDVIAPHAIRVTEEQPYHRMDDVPGI